MDDLTLIIQAARKSGDIAKRYFKAEPKVWDKGDNAGPVTEADLAVNTFLSDELQSQRPDYGWLSEETEDDANRLDQESVFIVDPIDGTRAFIEGSSHWAHSIAIAKAGVVTTAAVYLPVVDLLFTATKNGGAFLNGDPIQVTTRSQTPGACILASKANFQDKYWPGGFPDIRRSFRSSLAYRLCLVAQGSFDGMLTLRPTWEWDVAAGCLIVEESGGVATDQIGAQTTFNNPTPQLHGIVASNTNIHRDLMAGLT